MNVTQGISPLPWEGGTALITDATGDSIVQCFRALKGTKEANAAFIVKAVNAHNKVVEVLKAVRDLLEAGRPIPLFLVEAALLEAGEPI